MALCESNTERSGSSGFDLSTVSRFGSTRDLIIDCQTRLDRNRFAISQRRRVFPLTDGVERVFVEAAANRMCNVQLGNIASFGNDCILPHIGQSMFRAMKAETDGLPKVGRSSRELGVRIEGPARDLPVGQDGIVEPRTGECR